MAQYGINVADANQLVRAAYAGEKVGSIYEEERKFDLVVRLADRYHGSLDLARLSLPAANGQLIPLSEIATVVENESPMLISREQARRFINIGVNVRNRDVASLVADIEATLSSGLELPPGYDIYYGGQFENLQSARQRLMIAVPIALGMILLLLYLAFSSFRYALVLLLLMLFPADRLSAQGIGTFSDLYGFAVANDPELANQRLIGQAEGLNRRTVGAWSALEIFYQGGQLNTGDFDHHIAVQQNLSFLFNRAPQTALIDARVAEIEANQAVVLNELGYSLARAYAAWNYSAAQLALTDSVLLLYRELEPQLLVRREAGTLGAIDEELFRQKVRGFVRQRAVREAKMAVAEYAVRAIARLPDSLDLRPRPPELAVLLLNRTATDTFPYARVVEAQLARHDRESKLNRVLGNQPRIAAGYFAQSFENDWLYQGVTVGVGIPLDRRGVRVREEQFALQREQLKNTLDGRLRNRETRLGLLGNSVEVLRQSITGTARDRILRIARLQFTQGLIDFLTFSQLSESLLADRRDRLEQLRQFQELAVELSYLTNSLN